MPVALLPLGTLRSCSAGTESDALDMGQMGTYLLFNTGGDAIGGMMNSPNSPRPAWLFYLT